MSKRHRTTDSKQPSKLSAPEGNPNSRAESSARTGENQPGERLGNPDNATRGDALTAANAANLSGHNDPNAPARAHPGAAQPQGTIAGSTDQPGEGMRNPENAAIARDLNNPPSGADLSRVGARHPNDPLLNTGTDTSATHANPSEGGVDLPSAEAAAKAANLPPQNIPLVATAQAPEMTPAQAFPGEETKTMISPREFIVLLDGHRGRVKFVKGVQEVPTSLQEHRYVKNHQVTFYDKPRAG